MEILKPIFCATSLVGIHITGPFSRLLFDNETSYSVLFEAFPKLYENLTNVEPKYLLTSDHVLSFTSKELHIECILDSILACAETYEKVVQLLNIMVPKLAEGFSNQRGAIFGFGPSVDKDTGTIFKLSKADGSKRVKLLGAPVSAQFERGAKCWSNQL